MDASAFDRAAYLSFKRGRYPFQLFVCYAWRHRLRGTELCGSGFNCTLPDTNSINAAIGLAATGGTIVVCDGVYNEQVVVNKSVTLAGSGNAVIQPTTLLNDQDAVTVTGATTSATMSGFIV